MSKNVINLPASQIQETLVRRFKALVGYSTDEPIITRPACIVGHAGVGKSEIVRQVARILSEDGEFMTWAVENARRFYPNRSAKEAREMVEKHKVQCRTTNLQFCEPPDFLGLPFVSGKPGEEYTRHARPEILPSEGLVVWFLDEANRCSRDNRAGMLTLIQDRMVNGHGLGMGAMIVMAQNPSEADGVSYEVAEFDAALMDRIVPVEFKGSADETIRYLENKWGDDDPVVRWITNHPENIDFQGKTRTSPRSLEFCIKALRAEGGVSAPHAYSVMAAELGQEGASALHKFLSAPEKINAEEVVDKYNAKTAKKIQRLEDQGRNDILNNLNNAIVNLLRQRLSKAKFEVDKNGVVTGRNRKKAQSIMENVTRYLEDAPADMKATFLMAAGDQLYTEVDSRELFDKISNFWMHNSEKVREFVMNTPEDDKSDSK